MDEADTRQTEQAAPAPEQALWTNVLGLAIEDALRAMKPRKAKRTEIAPNTKRAHRKQNHEGNQALEWFRANGADFRTVCLCAGVDPNYIRDLVLSGTIQKTNIMQSINLSRRRHTSEDDDAE
jgi:hypothetical protein